MMKEKAVETKIENREVEQGAGAEALEKQVAKTTIKKENPAVVEEKKKGIFAKLKEAFVGNPEEALRERTTITIRSAIKNKLISGYPTQTELDAYYEAAKNDPDKPYKGRPYFGRGKLEYQKWVDVATENPFAGGGVGSSKGVGKV